MKRLLTHDKVPQSDELCPECVNGELTRADRSPEMWLEQWLEQSEQIKKSLRNLEKAYKVWRGITELTGFGLR